MPDRRTIAVIDGNSLMHRAFHAIRQPMSAPDGRSTNALFGFFNMFIKLVDTFRPDGVICAFDRGKPRVRMEMLPQYKAQRPPMDPALHEQFPMVKELLGALDVPVCELEGWEGDDILGTLAHRGEAAGYEMLLFTGDRDMYQLATANVKIVSTKKGVSDVVIMTPESVDDLYHGITPELVPDFYGLKGDTSDNIPGVPGIGPKKAAALIVQYGNLDEVIAHADEVKGKMGENLRAHVDDALLSRRVATIRTDAPIELDLADAKFPTFDPARVVAAFSALGFTGMTSRLVKLSGASAADVAVATSAAASAAGAPAGEKGAAPVAAALDLPPVVTGADAEAALAAAIEADAWVGCSLDDDRAAGALFGLGHTLWAATEGALCRFDGADADAALERLFRQGRVAATGVKGLLHALSPMDSAEPARLACADVDPGRIFDASVAAYLLESDASDYGAKALCERHLGCPLPEPAAAQDGQAGADDAPTRAAAEAAAARALVPALADALEKDGSAELFSTIEMPLLPVLAQMEREGLSVDPSILAAQSAELGAEISAMVDKIHAAAGEDFNLDSPMQLSHVLFDVLGLPTKGLKKTSRGFYSTNARCWATSHETTASWPRSWSTASGPRSAQPTLTPCPVRGPPTIACTPSSTRPSPPPAASRHPTPTCRTSPCAPSSAAACAACFVPLRAGDCSCRRTTPQIELRLLAHLSGDEHLVAAFNSGADFHAATAARVFGMPVDAVTPQLRSRAEGGELRHRVRPAGLRAGPNRCDIPRGGGPAR